ncbi:uncharacterized protein LOC115212224 [Argonauta hians]
MRLRIDFPQKAAFVLGVILSIFGIASIIIAVIAFSEKIWGHYLGTGLWCGIFMFLTGLCGVVAGQLRKPCAVKTYLITSVISTCLSAVMLVLSAGGLDFNSNFYKHSSIYKKYPRSTNIVHIFSLCLAIFSFITSLTSVGVCIKYLFFQKANNCPSNQSSRENDNLMCGGTSSEICTNNASTSRTPLRERTFSRSNTPRETASIHTPLRENEPLASTSSNNTRLHPVRHAQSRHINTNSSNCHSNETNRSITLEHIRHEQSCEDNSRRSDHVDLPRRINGTPSSTYSDHSQNSYLAAVELMPAASTDFPPQYDDLTPNVFGEDELPPYEEVIQELTDTSEGEVAVNEGDIPQERYVNCPVVNADPTPVSSGAGTNATTTTAKTVTSSPLRLATISSISLPPLSTSSGNNKSDVQLSKYYKQNVSKENSRSIPARPASDCHISRSLNLRNTNSQSMYAVASEATTQDGNHPVKSSLVSSNKANPQGVTLHDFSGVVINRAQYQLKPSVGAGSSRPKSQPLCSSESLRAGDREYITVKDSYENCNGDKHKTNPCTSDTSSLMSPNLPHLPPRLHSPTRTNKSSHSLHHTEHHHLHHHHHHHHHHRSQNKQTISTSLSAKCEPTKVSNKNTDKTSTNECKDVLGTSSQNQVSSHSDCSGVKLVPLSKETLSSGNRSKHYNRNKREIILPAKEFDPLAASMKAAEKLSMMENSEKNLRDGHSRNKHSECTVHKSEGKCLRSKEDKCKDPLLVCRPKARLECGKSGVIRYSSDRSQRKSSSTQAERLNQFRWSDSKKRAALQQKLSSSVRDWDTNEHSQQKIVAEFSPASIFQCPPSQSSNVIRMHDMKKASPSLSRKSGTVGVHSIGVCTNKSVNPRDEIHVAPEEILKIRTNPNRDCEGSAFIVSSSAAAEVRYVPRLFEKSPPKKCSSPQNPSKAVNGTKAAPTAPHVSTATSWSNGIAKSTEHNDSDDHDDSEPLYSNEISSSCSTPSSLMSSGSSMSCAGRELTERPSFSLPADVTRKLVSSEQAYMNISEANTVVVPMARISPLTVNKSCSSSCLVSGISSSPVTPAMLANNRTSVGSLQTPTSIVAKNNLQLQDNASSPGLFKSSPSKYVNTEIIRRHTPSPTLPPPLLSPSRNNTQAISDEEVPVSLEPLPSALIPATVDVIEIAGAESKVLNKLEQQQQSSEPELIPDLEIPNENNPIEPLPVSAGVNCENGEVIEVSNQGRDVEEAAAAPPPSPSPAAAVVNVFPQVNAESKPMYSILL